MNFEQLAGDAGLGEYFIAGRGDDEKAWEAVLRFGALVRDHARREALKDAAAAIRALKDTP